MNGGKTATVAEMKKAAKKAKAAGASGPPKPTAKCSKPNPFLAARSRCSGKGFSDPDVIAAFVKDFKKDVVKNWAKMKPAERFAAVKKLQEKQFDGLGIPAPKISRSKSAADGYDNPPTLFGMPNDKAWSMTYNGHLFDTSPLSEHDQKELAKTMMHEGRHIEQYYKIAEYRAAEGATADDIRTKDTPTHNPASIPKKAATQAAKTPLPKKGNKGKGPDCDAYKKAKEWNDAKYGKGALSQYRPGVAYADRPLEKDAFALEPTIDAKW